MSVIEFENFTLGEGRPKIIVPMVEKTEEAILAFSEKLNDVTCDFVEWRIDHYEHVGEEGVVSELSHKIKEKLDKPLLITFRSEREGGVKTFSDEEYFDLYEDVLTNGKLDLLDVELYMPEGRADEIISLAQEKQVKVVLCNHDFDATPAKDEIVNRLKTMADRGADVCKIAVMPNSPQDVLDLLQATQDAHTAIEQPLITMSMGDLGKVSRACGELVGSSATFGALGEGSAPGQINVDDLEKMLEILKL